MSPAGGGCSANRRPNRPGRAIGPWRAGAAGSGRSRRRAGRPAAGRGHRPAREGDAGAIAVEAAPDDPCRPVGRHQQRHGKAVHRRHRALDIAGADDGDPDPVPRQLAPQGLSQHPHRGLAAAIGRGAGKPRKPASELMIAIWPRRRGRIRATAGWIVLSTPSRLTAKMRRAWASDSPPSPVPAEMPALATTRSRAGDRRLRRSSRPSPPRRSRRPGRSRRSRRAAGRRRTPLRAAHGRGRRGPGWRPAARRPAPGRRRFRSTRR